jgi:hypothetical protein
VSTARLASGYHGSVIELSMRSLRTPFVDDLFNIEAGKHNAVAARDDIVGCLTRARLRSSSVSGAEMSIRKG